ncbi:anonymous antigen-7 like protein, putative [Babesia ovata]|uniref:Anonymous antigen-7 like protein, putative n=1 Tax=Babesia ovata TaxID=189622 RepID=A0A2H6KDT7_9APIC|nr:anonymous antigen-7 like protein, putative [Babesia ovata]GBE61162.1 anonymous antigen-7 like protein, putative [Babesia ovata]
MIICDNCGEPIVYSGEGDVTCGICGVVQQLYSQTIVEEFSASYSQTQKIGRLKPASQTDARPSQTEEEQESRDFQFIVGIQMVLDNLCKTLVRSYGFSNQVEVEAKNLWARYLTLVVENEVPVSNMFCDPFTKGQKYCVDLHYLKRSFQIPPNFDTFKIPSRLHKVIRRMGQTSFEYATLVCFGVLEQQRKYGADTGLEEEDQYMDPTMSSFFMVESRPTKRKRPTAYDYSDIKAFLEVSDMSTVLEDFFENEIELPRSRRCSPTGFPINILNDVVAQRQLPQMPWLPNGYLYLEQTNPYRIAFLMEALYRHDFLWIVLHAYPNLEPIRGFERYLSMYGPVASDDLPAAIEARPLDLSVLCEVAKFLGVTGVEERVDALSRNPRRLRMELVNDIFVALVLKYFGENRDPDLVAFNLAWIAPRMDLQLVCGILFAALVKCRYAVVVGDIVRWVIQGRIPLRSSASLLSDSILQAAFREDHVLAPRMRYAPSRQEEATYNLFTNTNAPHSSLHLENTVSRLMACGVFCDGNNDAQGESASKVPPYNVHALCRRLVHHLRLPSNVLPVADLVINRVTQCYEELTSEDETKPDDGINSNVSRMISVYGARLGRFPSHAFAAACVLAACRMLWPVFHYNAPAFPRRAAARDDGDNPASDAKPDPNDNLLETHVIRRERFPQTIEFDSTRMRWVVRIPKPEEVCKALGRTKEVAPLKEQELSPGQRQFLHQIAESMRRPALVDAFGVPQAPIAVKPVSAITDVPRPSDLVPAEPAAADFLEPPDSISHHSSGTEFFFEARHRGYARAGTSALLWLFHHRPTEAVRALSEYHTACDTRLLRRIAADYALRVRPTLLTKNVIRMYLGPVIPLGCDDRIVSALKDVYYRNLWINMAGIWSGSVADCFGLREEDYDAPDAIDGGDDEQDSPLDLQLRRKVVADDVDRIQSLLLPRLEPDEDIANLKASLPGNHQIFYTVTELFSTYPYYSGWSPEKSLELDNYRQLVRNQRTQVHGAVKEMLVTQIVGEQNDTWTHIADSLESRLKSKGGGTVEWPDVLQQDSNAIPPQLDPPDPESDYRRVIKSMLPHFQDMGTVTAAGVMLPQKPWRNYVSLKNGQPARQRDDDDPPHEGRGCDEGEVEVVAQDQDGVEVDHGGAYHAHHGQRMAGVQLGVDVQQLQRKQGRAGDRHQAEHRVLEEDDGSQHENRTLEHRDPNPNQERLNRHHSTRVQGLVQLGEEEYH